MTPPGPRPHRSARRRLVARGWITDQHGAWPMATVPIIVGALMGGARWEHLALLAGWVAGFLFFNAASLWLRAPHRARYRPALLTWAGVAVGFGLLLVVLAPRLLWWVPVFAPLVAVALVEAWRRRGRSLPSRLSAVIACGLTCAVAYDWATGLVRPEGAWRAGEAWPWRDAAALTGSAPAPSTGWTHAWIVTSLLTAYFVGSVPYVRSLIRERGNRRWIAGSAAWHALATGGAVAAAALGAVSWAAPALWALLTARALLVPWDQARRGPWKPLSIGLGEVAACLLTAAALLLPA